MASPPRSSPATSPPYPHHTPLPLNNPRKRPSLHLTNTQNAPSKRRKQGSIASGASSAHPLRQTSFPPHEALGDSSAVRSPSVESDFTAITGDGARSAITAGSGRGGKGRKGRRGGKRRTLSGSATAEKSKQGRRGGLQSERSVTAEYGGEDDAEDEDDDDGGEGLDDGDGGEEMDKAAERKNLSVLVDAFGSEQIERYEMFRRVKLKKETVRKIANFTLAQSVPPAVITTINGYTKTFIGTLIERARDVQRQWAALETPPDTPQETRVPIDPTDFKKANPDNDVVVQEGTSISTAPGLLHNGDSPQTRSTPTAKQPDRPLGPLLPDHFREALRRYRRDGEATGTGLTGFSVGLGIPGTGSARLQGRRLFK